jgi:Tol biopolymer transport system component
MSAILNEDPPSISQVAPDLPVGLQRIVGRCLAKSPDERFQHASDLAFALEALSDSGTTAMPAVTRQVQRGGWVWFAAIAAIVLFAVALTLWWKSPGAVPVVEGVTQLTDDGEPKPTLGKLVTDGARIYFNEGVTGSLRIAQVAVTGGPTAPVPTRFDNAFIAGFTPQGSALLTLVGGYADLKSQAWAVPLPIGEPRRLGNIEAQDADYFPDGRIIFTQGRDIYVAAKDGSDPRKLASTDGYPAYPTASPDGQRFALTVFGSRLESSSLVEGVVNGSSIQPLLKAQNTDVCCAQWTPDGRYLLFRRRNSNGYITDIWALPTGAGFARSAPEPVRLTNGPIDYSGVVTSRDGKQVFALGTKRRGELVRYDVKSKQFVSFLSGVSAIDPTFSRDGHWVAYSAYPDHTLWRSRADGSDRLQLTYPPMRVMYPFISPDGKRVAFGTAQGEIYVVSMDGGTPEKVAGDNLTSATWSPDSTRLAMTVWLSGNTVGLDTFDFRTGKRSLVPDAQGLMGGQWVGQDVLVAAPIKGTKLQTFDFKTQKWSDLVSAPVVNWATSPDFKYLYFTTGGSEPKAMRIRLSDHAVETITSLKELRRVADWEEQNTQISVAPDGSAIFTRDVGTQEVYALSVKWP